MVREMYKPRVSDKLRYELEVKKGVVPRRQSANAVDYLKELKAKRESQRELASSR